MSNKSNVNADNSNCTTTHDADTTKEVKKDNKFGSVILPPLPKTPPDKADEQWTDVTSILTKISSNLRTGQMLHSPEFILHSAMTALEIGDHVLDNGMTDKIMYIENILNDEERCRKLFDVDSNSPKLLSIIDELLRMLWSFFNGNADKFSIFTCLYLHTEMHNHELNTNPILKTFCESYVMCCSYARLLVSMCDRTDDEDWSSIRTYNLNDFSQLDRVRTSLDTFVAKTKNELSQLANTNELQYKQKEAILYRFEFIQVLLQLLIDISVASDFNTFQNQHKELIEEQKQIPEQKETTAKPVPKMHTDKRTKEKPKPKPKSKQKAKHKTKKTKNKAKHKQKKQKKQQPKKKAHKPKKQEDSTNHTREEDNQDDFLKDVYLIDLNSKSKCTLPVKLNQKHNQFVKDFNSKSKHLETILDNIIRTSDLSDTQVYGFDHRIPLTAVHAPRKQRIVNREQSLILFKDWCDCLAYISQLTSMTTLDELMHFLVVLDRRQYISNIILRCFILNLFAIFGKYDTFLWTRKPLVHAIQVSFRDCVPWCRIYDTHTNSMCKDYFTFFSRVELAINDVLRQYLVHPTLQLGRIANRVLKNWMVLQTESPEIDQFTIHSYINSFPDKYHHLFSFNNYSSPSVPDKYKCTNNPFTSWILIHTITSMIEYLQLQLNQRMQCFAAYELIYVFWYLEYFYGTQLTIYEHTLKKAFNRPSNDLLAEIDNPTYAQLRKKRSKNKNKSQSQNQNQNQNQKKDDNKTEEANINRNLIPVENVATKTEDHYRYSWTEAQRHLCSGIFQLIRAFEKTNLMANKNTVNGHDVIIWEGLVNVKDKRLDSEELRYCHRLHVFESVKTPQYIGYKQYRDILASLDQQFITRTKRNLQNNNLKIENMTDLDVVSLMYADSITAFEKSVRTFMHLKSHPEFQTENKNDLDYIKKSAKIAITNSVFALKLKKVLYTNCKQLQPRFEIKIKHNSKGHPHFICFEIENVSGA